MRLLGVRHAALPVENLQRAIRFYKEILGFKVYLAQHSDWVMLVQGTSSLSLIPSHTTHHPAPVQHLGLVVDSPEEVERMHAHFQLMSNSAFEAPQEHRDGSYGFYFRDSENNPWECIFIPYFANRSDSRFEHPRTGMVFLAHGSNDPQWRATLEVFSRKASMHFPVNRTRLAYMESAVPTFEESAKQLIQLEQCKRVWIFPVFLSAGGHVTRDLPRVVQEVAKRFPDCAFEIKKALGESPLVQDALIEAAVDQIRETD